MDLTKVFDREAISLDLLSTSRDHVILEMVKVLEDQGHIDSQHRDEVLLALLKRESSSSTVVGSGVALPHVKTDCVDAIRGAIGISREGLDFNSPDGSRVKVIFLFLTPTWAEQEHLGLLATLGRLIRNPDFVQRLELARRQQDVFHLLQNLESFI